MHIDGVKPTGRWRQTHWLRHWRRLGGPVAVGKAVERKFAADVAEYSRLTNPDEIGTPGTLRPYRAILDRLILAFHGCIFKAATDRVVANFAGVVECNIAVQEAIEKENQDFPEAERMRFRIAYISGTSFVDEGNLFGETSPSLPDCRHCLNPERGVPGTPGDHIGSRLPVTTMSSACRQR